MPTTWVIYSLAKYLMVLDHQTDSVLPMDLLSREQPTTINSQSSHLTENLNNQVSLKCKYVALLQTSMTPIFFQNQKLQFKLDGDIL